MIVNIVDKSVNRYASLALAGSTVLNLCFFAAFLSGNARVPADGERAKPEDIPGQIAELREHLYSISPEAGVIVLESEPVQIPKETGDGSETTDKTRRMIVISPDLFRYGVDPQTKEITPYRGLGLEREDVTKLAEWLRVAGPQPGPREEKVTSLVIGPESIQIANDVRLHGNNNGQIAFNYEGNLSLYFNNLNAGATFSHTHPTRLDARGKQEKVEAGMNFGRKTMDSKTAYNNVFPSE